MADNYLQVTVTPYIPKVLLNDSELEILSEAGLTFEDYDGLLYFFSEEFFDLTDESIHVFHEVIKKAEVTDNLVVDQDLTEIIIEGAYTCSKMRQGEFGGIIVRITKDKCQDGSTTSLLEQFRREG